MQTKRNDSICLTCQGYLSRICRICVYEHVYVCIYIYIYIYGTTGHSTNIHICSRIHIRLHYAVYGVFGWCVYDFFRKCVFINIFCMFLNIISFFVLEKQSAPRLYLSAKDHVCSVATGRRTFSEPDRSTSTALHGQRPHALHTKWGRSAPGFGWAIHNISRCFLEPNHVWKRINKYRSHQKSMKTKIRKVFINASNRGFRAAWYVLSDSPWKIIQGCIYHVDSRWKDDDLMQYFVF